MTITLPTGKWSIYGNREQGDLNIDTVDGDGKWTGTAFGDKINGSFNATSGGYYVTYADRVRLHSPNHIKQEVVVCLSICLFSY